MRYKQLISASQQSELCSSHPRLNELEANDKRVPKAAATGDWMA